MPKSRYFVGIDLGTTYSTLAYVDESGSVEALRLPDGTCTLASAIYFKNPREVVVGTEALNYAVLDASRVAQEFKRQMGEKPPYTFTVDGKAHRPEELSAMVLKKLLNLAQAKLGPIDSAVISVPQVFQEARRRATQDAGRIAGLKEVDLVEEPVAAAIAFGHTLMKSGGFFSTNDVFFDQTVLVYDLGGGTFDATVMQLHAEKQGDFKVLATVGDERLGGKDWDMVLETYICEQLEKKTGCNPQNANNLEMLQVIRLEAIKAKLALSEFARAIVPVFYQGKEHSIAVLRPEFVSRSSHLLLRTEHSLTEMLDKTEMTWGHIDRVLLVGGSSRMPMVATMLERVTKRHLDMTLRPDVAVATGAALYAASKSMTSNIRVKTVNSHPLGLLVNNKSTQVIVNRVILKANQPTGTRVTRSFQLKPGQKYVAMPIYLGENEDPKVCNLLGKLEITDLPGDLPAKAKAEVGFSFQNNGLLHVDVNIFKGPNQPAIQQAFFLRVEGVMPEQEVQNATQTLGRGIILD